MIETTLWRCRIGTFSPRRWKTSRSVSTGTIILPHQLATAVLLFSLLVVCGDIESNPGPVNGPFHESEHVKIPDTSDRVPSRDSLANQPTINIEASETQTKTKETAASPAAANLTTATPAVDLTTAPVSYIPDSAAGSPVSATGPLELQKMSAGGKQAKQRKHNSDLKIVTPQTHVTVERSDEYTYKVAMGDDIYQSGNLHDKGKRCTTNEGHKGFTSIKDFGLSHLPPKLQHQDVVEFVKKWADCTVLIKTYFVSETRPDTFPGSQFRGMGVPMTGTGWCWSVERCARSDQFCQCQACKQSGQLQTSWWEVHVTTAAYVVFDDLEAANTEVVFFYDDTKSQTIKIHGPRVVEVDVESDLCELVCVVHVGEMDEVMNKLKGLCQDVNRVCDEFLEKYGMKGWDEHCVIISHPHGCTKQVSVGKWLEDERDSDGGEVSCYDAPTCPGSSGALVPWNYWFGMFGPPHSSRGKDGIGHQCITTNELMAGACGPEETLQHREHHLRSGREKEKRKKQEEKQKNEVKTHPSHVGGIPWSRLREEIWRLNTFCTYPPNSPKSAVLLAANGFAYLGRDGDDTVICCFCTVIYKGWQPRDDIKSVHARLRSDCPMINGTNRGNVPLSQPREGAELFTMLEPQPMTRFVEDPEIESVSEVPTQAPSSRQSRESTTATVPTHQTVHTTATVPTHQTVHTNGTSSTISSDNNSLNTPDTSGSNQPLTQTAGAVTGAGLAGFTTGAQSFQSTLQNEDPSSNLAQSQPSSQRVPVDNREPAQQSLHNNTPNPNAQNSRGSAHEAGNAPANNRVLSQVTSNNNTTDQEAPVSTAATESQGQHPSTPATSQTRTPSTTTSNSSSNEDSNGTSYLHLGIITDKPKRFEFAVTVARLNSFEGWPTDHHLTKEILADAGFYYAGYSDCVRCFFCGGGLRNWEREDDVWVEHARWFPKCAFLRQTKGAAFIAAVNKLNRRQGNISYQDVLRELGPQQGFLDSKAALRRDPAVIAVQRIGYSEEQAVAVAQALKEEGQMLSADQLLEKLQEKNYPKMKVRLDESRIVGGASKLAEDKETISKLKVENQELRQQTVCKICMDREVAVVFLPCGHFVCCSECALALKSCPVCRRAVAGIVRGFIV